MMAIRAAKVAMVGGNRPPRQPRRVRKHHRLRHQLRFVRHVLSMDSAFPNSTITWRAITNPALHHAGYALIIAAEAAIAVLCWIGAFKLLHRIRADARAFNQARRWPSPD